jgi:hypothetical protein
MISCLCFDYLVITPLYFDYLVHVVVFSTLGQLWLASIRSSRRGRPETATGGLLLPRAKPLSLPSRHEVGSSSRHHTAPPPSRMQEVRSFSHCCTTPPSLCQEEASANDSVEMWVVTPSPPPTRVEEESDDSPLDSLGYNDECPHVKEMSSYEHCFYIYPKP